MGDEAGKERDIFHTGNYKITVLPLNATALVSVFTDNELIARGEIKLCLANLIDQSVTVEMRGGKISLVVPDATITIPTQSMSQLELLEERVEKLSKHADINRKHRVVSSDTHITFDAVLVVNTIVYTSAQMINPMVEYSLDGVTWKWLAVYASRANCLKFSKCCCRHLRIRGCKDNPHRINGIEFIGYVD